MTQTTTRTRLFRLLSAASCAVGFLAVPSAAHAGVDGITGTSFNFTAKTGYVSIPDGASVYSWGYTNGTTMQYPGPTMIVTEGQTISVTLNNSLPAAAGNTSIVFPGMDLVSTTGGVPGAMTQEAQPGGTVTYTFTASKPGTYTYYSGTQPDLQIEMGLVGALIVEPAAPAAGCTASAYSHPETCFDQEYLFLLTDIDIDVHQEAELQASGAGPIDVGPGPFHPEYWLINGRAAPDTMGPPGTAVLPYQPYNSLPQMHPGDRVLARIIGGGRDMHPFHTHGNHLALIAQDGNVLVSETNANALAGPKMFTVPSVPGSTVDGIFQWTGEQLGWDMYGHEPDPITGELPPLEPNEYEPDHGKPIPVELPNSNSLVYGGFYSGSPFLGALGALPPGEGGLNPNAGFAYMWHSHAERELVNNDIFPGGMMTMMIVVPHWVEIP